MAIDPVKLSDWLRKAMLSPKLPPVRQIELLHVYAHGDAKTAYVWDWAENEPKPRIEEQIHEVTTQAETYANGIADGTVRFMLQAFHGSDHTPWGIKFPFYLVARSPEDETGKYGASEPATGQGLLSQLMRHLERREEMLSKMFDSHQRFMGKALADATTKNDLYEGRHFDTIKLYEDLLDRKHERELSALFRAREDERKSKMWSLVMSIAPMVAARFFDPKLVAALPAQVTDGGPAMQIVRRLTQSLGPEQLPMLTQALTPEQLMMLMELNNIMEGEKERDAQKEAEQRAVVPASADDMRRQRQAEAEAVEEADRAYTDRRDAEHVERDISSEVDAFLSEQDQAPAPRAPEPLRPVEVVADVVLDPPQIVDDTEEEIAPLQEAPKKKAPKRRASKKSKK